MMLRRRLWLATIVLAAIVLYHEFSLHSSSKKAKAVNGNRRFHLNVTQPKNAIASMAALPEELAVQIPAIQANFTTRIEGADAKRTRLERQAAVKEAFLHAWEGYKFHAFAKDEVRPISGSWRNSFGGWGATMVDTMDFLWLLGMKDDFDMCVDVVGKIDFTTNTEDSINVFEVTIRYLGGLLSAYDISGQKYTKLLDRAKELGDILYMAFDTPNHMPVTRWEWKKTVQGMPLDQSSEILLAELGSLTLEFTRLSQLTKDPKYYDAINRISKHLYKVQKKTKIPGLWPTIVHPETLDFSYNHFTFGGMVDSAYEYLPKEFLLLGGTVPMYEHMYKTAIETAKKYLFYRPIIPTNEDVLFAGNTGLNQEQEIITEFQAQHLSCFTGGMVAMASKIFSLPEDLQIARRLVDGCIWAYNAMPSGLMPEIFHLPVCYIGTEPDLAHPPMDSKCTWSDEVWYKAVASQQGRSEETAKMNRLQAGKYWVKEKSIHRGFTDHPDNRYILRPEAIESIFILYRTTGDASLMDKAWEIFLSIERVTRTQIAYAGIHDVRVAPADTVKSDRMESFFLAETLKYFWLIFSEPDLVNLDEWVLNTEAHMFRRPKHGEKIG